MKQIYVQTYLFLFFSVTCAMAQTMEGLVSGPDGRALSGVFIQEFGTKNAAKSNELGYFNIELSGESAIQFSLEGYASIWMNAVDSFLEVRLQEDFMRDGIVMTALGLKQNAQSLSFSAPELHGSTLRNVKDLNFNHSLAGRVAGLQIDRSASGMGGSARVRLRGNRSVSDNQVLYVLDGIPLFNFSPAQATGFGGQSVGLHSAGRDGGDAISNLNPEDIETLTVLKGPAASILYGGQAANGAIVINSKKAKTGALRASFSSQYMLEEALDPALLQYRYGSTLEGGTYSWGEKDSISDHVTPFFQRGRTMSNALTLSGGTDKAQTYFSYGYTTSEGIIPTSKLVRHNFNIRETADFMHDRLQVSAAMLYTNQESTNRPVVGMNFNPLIGLYLFPRGMDFEEYSTNYEQIVQGQTLKQQNWISSNTEQQNPYWILNRNPSLDQSNRYLGMMSARLRLLKGIQILARGQLDKTYNRYEQKAFASTASFLANQNGRYLLHNTQAAQRYGDATIQIEHNNLDMSLLATAGVSMSENSLYAEFHDSYSKGNGLGLQVPNEFSLQNMATTGGTNGQNRNRQRLVSGFGMLQLGYRNQVFMEVAARNDWTTTLANTDNTGSIYPSAGVSFILTEILRLPFLNFAKIRGAYAHGGNNVMPYLNNPLGSFLFPQGKSVLYPDVRTKVERTKSMEFGLEVHFWKDRARLETSVYSTNSINQRLHTPAPENSGFSTYFFPSGNIRNQGIETSIMAEIVQKKRASWQVMTTFSTNQNKIMTLDERLENGSFSILEPNGGSYGMIYREGGSVGDILGQTFKRNAWGHILVGDDGLPMRGGMEVVGNANPKFMLGLENRFTVRNVEFSVLLDGRFGGEVMSITQAVLDKAGVSESTAAVRDAEELRINGLTQSGVPVSTMNIQAYYQFVGGTDGISEFYIYDATNVRVREASLSISFPGKPMRRMKNVRSIKLAVVGRNLAFLIKNAPFDPELSMNSGNFLQGVDVFAPPSTRTLGLRLTAEF